MWGGVKVILNHTGNPRPAWDTWDHVLPFWWKFCWNTDGHKRRVCTADLKHNPRSFCKLIGCYCSLWKLGGYCSCQSPYFAFRGVFVSLPCVTVSERWMSRGDLTSRLHRRGSSLDSRSANSSGVCLPTDRKLQVLNVQSRAERWHKVTSPPATRMEMERKVVLQKMFWDLNVRTWRLVGYNQEINNLWSDFKILSLCPWGNLDQSWFGVNFLPEALDVFCRLQSPDHCLECFYCRLLDPCSKLLLCVCWWGMDDLFQVQLIVLCWCILSGLIKTMFCTVARPYSPICLEGRERYDHHWGMSSSPAPMWQTQDGDFKDSRTMDRANMFLQFKSVYIFP